MKPKVTIQDIADALGISRNTVSKAINNSEGIADATREKILQKAIEMGYKQFSYVNSLDEFLSPASAAAGGRGSFAGEIALLSGVFFTQSHFASVMLDRFHRELSQMGYSLSMHRVEPENIASLTLPITFSKERISGIVCIEMFDRKYDEMICSLGLPVLFVDGPNKRSGFSLPCDQLYMENTAPVTEFVNGMLERGIKKIGFIGNWEHCQSFFERYTAFRSAMTLAGVPVEEKYCIKEQVPEEVEKRIMALKSLPDVFICANDFVADDTIRSLAKHGKKVPDDVMFCGFDDAPESRNMQPPLTTIHIHTQIMAFSAAELILSRIREPSLDYRIIHTETYLIRRASTRD